MTTLYPITSQSQWRSWTSCQQCQVNLMWFWLHLRGEAKRVEGEISIVQSIQLGFLLSLGSATSNEANKRAMLRAEWTNGRTITARRAVLCLAQMKYRYFDPESCKQNAIFSGHLKSTRIKMPVPILCSLSYPSSRSKPRNPVLRPAVLCYDWFDALDLAEKLGRILKA